MTAFYDSWLCERWLTRPLCRRYAVAAIGTTSMLPFKTEADAHRTICWVLGSLINGDSEILGAWNIEKKSSAPSLVFGDIHARGVDFIRVVLCDLANSEWTFNHVYPQALVAASVEQQLTSAASLVPARHRASVLRSLRLAAEAADLETAHTELAKLQGTELGKKYRGIVELWGSALSRFEVSYALDASLRELIRSTDQAAAVLTGRLNRDINDHGPFTDSAAAFDFVVGRLAKAEADLDRSQSAGWAVQRRRAYAGRAILGTSGAVGVPMLA